jgi:ComF family protein
MHLDFKNYLGSFLDFILPRFCVHCTKKLHVDEKFICSSCFEEIKSPDYNILASEFRRKFDEKKLISGFASAFIFEKDSVVQSIIHTLKYNQNFSIGIYVGKLAAIELQNEINSWNGNLIVPVPLHSLKKAERGYNQSLYIAKGISSVIKLPLCSKALQRIRFTKSQTTMNMEERQKNISGAFRCKKVKDISGRRIILVDDVITTGATTNEAASALLEAGAEKVFAMSSAIAEV